MILDKFDPLKPHSNISLQMSDLKYILKPNYYNNILNKNEIISLGITNKNIADVIKKYIKIKQPIKFWGRLFNTNKRITLQYFEKVDPQIYSKEKLLDNIVSVGIVSVSIIGVGYGIKIILKENTTTEENEINDIAESIAIDLSGCFIINRKLDKSVRVDLLSCNGKTTENSLETCSSSDSNCNGKFNPCIRDSKNDKIPSECSKIVVSSISNRLGVSEYIACDSSKECSKFCNIDNFNYDKNIYDMECRNISGDIIKLQLVSLLTGTSWSVLLSELFISQSKSSAKIIWILLFIVIILLVLYLIIN